MNNLAASEFLGLIGNEKRLAILKMLLQREMTVSTLADEVSLSLPCPNTWPSCAAQAWWRRTNKPD